MSKLSRSDSVIQSGVNTALRPGSSRALLVIILVVIAVAAGIIVTNTFGVRARILSAAGMNPGTCSMDKKLLRTYNQAATTKGLASLESVTKDIKKSYGSQQDITCDYMLLVTDFYSEKSDNAAAVRDYDQYDTLAKKGQTVSKSIDDGVDVKAMISGVEEMRTVQEKGTPGESDGQG